MRIAGRVVVRVSLGQHVRLGLSVVALFLLVSSAAQARAGRCPRGFDPAEYRVKKGDTLSRIASRHGAKVAQLAEANPGVNRDALREGQKLKICLRNPDAPKRRRAGCGSGREVHDHEVKRGETLKKIAQRYAVAATAIVARNEALGGDADRLRAGQRLKVCAQPSRARGAKACKYRTPLHKHEVVPGEWLAEIASRYGVRQRELARLNKRVRNNPDFLRPGDLIRVCPEIAPRRRSRIQHTVQPGQTFASIAKRYHLNPRQLRSFQRGRIDDPNELRPGQKLVVWKDGGIVSEFTTGKAGKGALPNGIQLPPGKHYSIKNKRLAWATPRTVRLLQKGIAKYRARQRRAPNVRVGDLSRKGGGRFPPHKSHRTGQDVDVAYVIKGKAAGEKRFPRATEKNIDLKRTWALIQAFLDTDAVRYMFIDYRIQGWLYDYAKKRGVRRAVLDELFQYPRGKQRAYGIIRDDPGHDDHLHVRFW